MNAVIWFFALPFTIFGGVFAITTITPAFVPFVHQSFSPLRMKCFPSGGRLGVRLHVGGIGTDAGFGEREGGNFAFGDARQIFAFLLLGAEQESAAAARRWIDARRAAR